MKILGLVDIHSKIELLEDLIPEIEEVDLVLIAGDITNFGKTEEAARVLAQIRTIAKNLYAVSGNCDYPEVDTFLTENDLHLENAPRLLNDMGFLGVGGSLPCPSRTPHEHTEDEIEALLAHQVKKLTGTSLLVSVVHQPPLNTKIDLSLLAGHVGSQAVRSFIERYQPLLSFSGHIHESVGIDRIGSTTVVNPGPFLKGNYFVAEVGPDKVEIELKRLR